MEQPAAVKEMRKIPHPHYRGFPLEIRTVVVVVVGGWPIERVDYRHSRRCVITSHHSNERNQSKNLKREGRLKAHTGALTNRANQWREREKIYSKKIYVQ